MNASDNSKLRIPRLPLLLLLVAAIALQALLITRAGWIGAVAPLLIMLLVLFLVRAFARPETVLISYLIASFIVNGAGRYLQDVPLAFGLILDGLLLLGLAVTFWQSRRRRMEWHRLANSLVLVNSIWFFFTVLSIFNPESRSTIAWFYAMRGVALYIFIAIPLVMLFFNRMENLRLFLRIWGLFSLAAFIKGFLQIHVGVDPFEQRWLDGGGALTHIIWGQLRAFSFYSDAGQFGAAQAHVATVALLILFRTQRTGERIFFALVALAGAYGTLLSGTRGALFIPLAGIMLYLLLSRKPALIFLGLFTAAAVIFFFKFTYIGQSNYHIRRMRTAFNFSDASLQVRLQNQRILANYLKDRPLGGGVGSAGYWGGRFTPGTLLADTPTDSWYVRIWAEQGIVGLTLYLAILLVILMRSVVIVWTKIRDPELLNICLALLSGCFGIFVASYGNSVFGQSPTGPVMQFSLAFIFLAPAIDRELAGNRITQEAS